MKYILTASQMKNADEYAAALGKDTVSLMEKASEALFFACKEMTADMHAETKTDSVFILCGKGNNAGDGLCLAKMLYDAGFLVGVGLLSGTEFTKDTAIMFSLLNKEIVYDDKSLIIEQIKEASLVVDCIFGTGFKGEIPEDFSTIIQAANEKPVLSCDLPSGVVCDNGQAAKLFIKAARTVTFQTYKPCHFLYPAKEYCGEITLADIDMPQEAIEKQKPYIFLNDESIIDEIIKPRRQNTHKGSYGGLQTVCGSRYMTGACYLSAMGALRSGVGLLYISCGDDKLDILQSKLAEPVFVERRAVTKATAFLLGCGTGEEDSKLVVEYLSRKKPTVIDADCITYISQYPEILKEYAKEVPIILTPHPFELSRLLKIPVEKIENDRINIARECAKDFNITLILKGHHTLIASPDGRIFVNTTGNAGLAKGGSGDVLAGIVGGLLSQGYSALESCQCGVWLHGRAADLLKEDISEYGLLPSELPLYTAKILKKYNS